MNLNFKLKNKTTLFIAAGSLVLIMIVWLGIMRPLQKTKSLNKDIPKKEKELQELIALRDEYSEYKLKKAIASRTNVNMGVIEYLQKARDLNNYIKNNRDNL